MLSQVGRDIRVAVRRLASSPVFTCFAIASLAIGIGVSTATCAAVRAMFWPPLGVPQPRTLVAKQTSFSAFAAGASFAAAIATASSSV